MGATVKTPSVPRAKAPAPRPAPAAASSKAAAVPAARTGPSPAGASTLLTAGPAAVGEMDLSSGSLQVPAALAETLADGVKLDVPVRLPGLAQGSVQLRWSGGHFSSQRDQGIALDHPALAALAASTPMVLVLHVVDDAVTGWVGLGQPGPAKGNPRAFFDAVKKGGDALGWLGLSGITVPSVHNVFAGGLIDARAEGLAFTVGGFLSGTGNAVLDNKALAFDGGAKVQIPGGSSGELLIKKDAAGLLAGRLDITVSIGKVNGTVTATLTNGFVSVLGGVGYDGDRLSGKLTLIATDEATARDVTLKKPEGGADVTIELPGPDKPAKPGKRAFCGWGQLNFQVTDWLAGTATVLVNSQGQATIIGEIAPPKEFILFEQKEWIKRIFKAEIRAGYGIPVVGQVGLFASISLDAIAKVGPGKLYKIKLAGAYSTDPRVAKQLSIEASLNISAFAGLRARAEAGLLVTILAHDIKAGVGLDAIAGVRGYVEATPKIGMRELTPGGKRQYYIQGHMEIAAQPILGFSGDLFVAIETPWWSPLSDKRWTWPLFSLEYPLPGEFGIGADVDYVLGSKQWPTISFGEVNFDSSKFLTDVMNDNTDKGSGGEAKKPGEWAEGLGGKGKGGAKNKGGSGKQPGEMGADAEPVGTALSFSDGHETHRLWFKEQAGGATLLVASEEGPVAQRLSILKGKIPQLQKPDRSAAELLIAKALSLLPQIQDEAKQVAAMKEAERNAKETYKKHGNDKGKKKGKKESRKEKNKKLKTDEGKLEAVLKDIFSLMRMENWKNIKKPAKWTATLHGKVVQGKEDVEMVAGSNVPSLQTTKDIVAMETGPLSIALNPAGRDAAKATRANLAPQLQVLSEIPIAGGKVQASANASLLKITDLVAPVVGKLGQRLKLKNFAQAKGILRMSLAWPVVFNVNKTPEPAYETNFRTEMLRQLKEQQTALNQLTVDTWVARVDTYKSKLQDKFNALDDNARKAVEAEIRKKVAEIAPVAGAESALFAAASAELNAFLTEAFKGQPVDIKKLTPPQQRRYQQLRRQVKEADLKPLEKFLKQHSDLSKLSVDEQKTFTRLAERAKAVGRSGQETEFQALHQEGIAEVVADRVRAGQWKGLHEWQGTAYALLHNPDQVAGGHGKIAELAPVKKPVKPSAPSEAELKKFEEDRKAWQQYKAELSKFVGQKWVNSIIGGGWGSKIPSLRPEITSAANYNAEIYGLWRMNLKLSHVVVASK